MQERRPVELAVSGCGACGLIVYPAGRSLCPRCGSARMTAQSVSGDGTIWTYTVQRFAPKSPPYVAQGDHEPFVVAYVETADGIRIEGIVACRPEDARIGQRLVLVSTSDVPRYRLASDRGGSA